MSRAASPPLALRLPRRGEVRQDRRAPSFAARGASGFHPGIEAPLDVEARPTITTRHAVSLRWLGACVLAGLAGGALLGAAIFVASRGEITFAETAELAAPSRAAPDSGAGTLRKGDKLIRAETIATAKQTFKAPMTIRVGDREIIRPRSFTKVSTGLSLTSGIYATNIPPFNPMRFFNASEPDRVAAPEPAPVADAQDADVSVVKTDLASIVVEPSGPALSDADILAQIEDGTQASDDPAARQLGLLPLPAFLPRVVGAGVVAPASSFLSGAAGESPFRSIEVRVVPENVTSLPKSSARAGDLAFEDRAIPLKRGESLDAVLVANGVSPEEARAVTAALGGRERVSGTESLQLQLLFAPAERPGERRQILRARLIGERGIEAIAAMNDRRVFVSVAPPPAEAAAPEAKPQEGAGSEDDEEEEGTGARLYDSLYETAAKQELPRGMIEELIRVFGTDVDFQRRVASGDGLELFYANEDESVGDRPDLLSARLTIGTDTRQIFRYQGDDGTIDYLDQDGRSLRKFLLRKPITDAKITSPFGSRFHPILGYSKTHTGVDWGSKIGTPILAAGNGTVIKAEWAGGYGRRTEIQHGNGYVTAYNHQSGFARGIVPGAKVRQGQVIGYVGTTGLSTGPHLHYEVIINGRFVDPMKIRVPRGKELDGRMLADFNRQKDQIAQLEKRAGSGNPFAVTEAR